MDGTAPRARASARDYWPLAVAAAHLGHTLWFGSAYPEVVYDPDLLAYFVYWTNLVTGTTSLHDAPYFTVPKPLLVFLLGPLDNAQAAFAVSALAAGVFGALVYLIATRLFGRPAALLCSAVLLLDVDRATLTARASADFFLALFLFASIHLTLGRRYRLSGLAIALAALVKPVALPCAVHLLAVEGEDRRRAWAGAAIALVALPLTLLSNHLLLGSAFGTQRFFAGFAAMSDGAQMATGDLLRFVLWVELAKTIFVATAPFGVLGLIVWIGADRRRLTSPFLLVPLALLAGYVALSITTPFIAFFRFFWPVQVWFACFVVVGMLETCRRLAPESRTLRLGAAAALFFFLFDEQMARQLRYRTHFAAPFQRAMSFVATTDGLLASARTSGQTILTPLAFFPYLLWTIDDVRHHPALVRMAEVHATQGAAGPPPDWVIYVPSFFLRAESREPVERLLASGMYAPVLASPDGIGALYLRRDHRLASAD
jgi:hypothetical protein